jgi:hypothetical protein
LAVFHSGNWVCQSALARYVVNGDGTLTDNQTGLMWEMKDSTCNPVGPHCWTNLYAWSTTGVSADGPLYTDFLAKLNLDSSADGSAVCFANHCDWRLPTIVELQALRLACTSGVCIDPIFGPTQDGNYWSSTSLDGQPDAAWLGQFNIMNPSGKDVLPKGIPLFARAVRSIR